ncbi:Xylose isomerase, partial [Haemophilus influenzae]
VLCKWW